MLALALLIVGRVEVLRFGVLRVNLFRITKVENLGLVVARV